ncbi:MAG: hypothetical protein M1819_001037 [Sarea resinae]|nr:MAG: hypothetical protein M1819_001037 [Sarea resinae]
MANPQNKSPERGFFLQKYLLLHSQHSLLLHQRSSPSSASGTTDTYPDTPSTRGRRSSSITSTSSISPSTSSSQASPSSFAPLHRADLVEEQDGEDDERLYDVNHQIKTVLTQLLNCDSVKHDNRFRNWVQSRLMDAEHELKQQRRRRSLGGASEEQAANIGRLLEEEDEE